MREFTEDAARWVILGTASGAPMLADTACKVLNEVLNSDRVGTSQLFLWSPHALNIINKLVQDGHVSMVIDIKTGGIERFEAGVS